jgi:hypothetical protein
MDSSAMSASARDRIVRIIAAKEFWLTPLSRRFTPM